MYFSLIPQYTSGLNQIQYVDVASFNNESRYILGSLAKKIYDLSLRINVSFTPELSLQYYAQPYIFAGKYSDYKRINDPRASRFTDRYHQFSNNEISFNESWNAYMIDEDHDGADDYGFYKPDFHFLQFRSNMVLRWEYKTGSSLYLVWSQGRTDVQQDGENNLSQYLNELRDIHPRNDFMLKISYLVVL